MSSYRENAVATRKQLLARLHCIKKDNGWDDDTYRDILHARTGKRSAADLEGGALARLVAQLGWQKPRSAQRARAHEWAFVAQRPEHEQKQWRYLIVLCRQAGVTRGSQVAYCTSIARQMHGYGRCVENPPQLWSEADLANVVNAMVYAARRAKKRNETT